MSQTYMQRLAADRQSAGTPYTPTPTQPANPYQPPTSNRPTYPGTPTYPGSPKSPLPPTPSKTPIQPTAVPAIGLLPIKMTSIRQGGYVIGTTNYTKTDGQLLLLEIGSVCIDITSGYTKNHLAHLLEAIAYGSLWAETGPRTIAVRLLLVKPGEYFRQPDEEYLRVVIGGFTTPFGQYCTVLTRSERQLLPAPVRPVIDSEVGRGAAALTGIGNSQPKIEFAMEARYLSKPICNRCYFLFNDMLELKPFDRTLNCTTYIMSCYRYTESAIAEGTDLCQKIGATLIEETKLISHAKTNAYLSTHGGSYIVLKFAVGWEQYTSHVLAYSNRSFHEFNIVDGGAADGYHTFPALDEDNTTHVCSIYRMP